MTGGGPTCQLWVAAQPDLTQVRERARPGPLVGEGACDQSKIELILGFRIQGLGFGAAHTLQRPARVWLAVDPSRAAAPCL